MKTLLLASLVSIFTVGTAISEITPMLIKISSTTTHYTATYTVPAGKVLIIENYTISAYQGKYVRLYKDSDVIPLSPSWSPPPAPLKVPEGWTIRIDKVTVGETYTAYLFCLLVDPADLYAYVPSQIDSFSIADNTGSLTVNLASARPSKISIEQSSDLKTWESDPSAEVHKDSFDKTQYQVSVTCTNQAQFYRAVAKAQK